MYYFYHDRVRRVRLIRYYRIQGGGGGGGGGGDPGTKKSTTTTTVSTKKLKKKFVYVFATRARVGNAFFSERDAFEHARRRRGNDVCFVVETIRFSILSHSPEACFLKSANGGFFVFTLQYFYKSFFFIYVSFPSSRNTFDKNINPSDNLINTSLKLRTCVSRLRALCVKDDFGFTIYFVFPSQTFTTLSFRKSKTVTQLFN